MKILLTGGSGQVGYELRRSLAPLGEVVAPDSRTLNLADADSIVRVVRELKPDLIVNPGAYTAVDKAETEVDLALAINGIAPGILAEEGKLLGAPLVHYSTDYVFDGTKADNYVETDPTNPLNVYGRSKLAGEQAIQQVGGAHLILRTSWVYGARGKNFLLTMVRLMRERPEVRVVNDQWGAPTWSRLIADVTAHLAANPSVWQEQSGIFNLTAGGKTSWSGFATAIRNMMAAQSKAVANVMPISSAEYPVVAVRPANSALSTEKLCKTFGFRMPAWDESLELVMRDIGVLS